MSRRASPTIGKGTGTPKEIQEARDVLSKCRLAHAFHTPGRSVKYLQEDYWGSTQWDRMFDLRSAVEAVLIVYCAQMLFRPSGTRGTS